MCSVVNQREVYMTHSIKFKTEFDRIALKLLSMGVVPLMNLTGCVSESSSLRVDEDPDQQGVISVIETLDESVFDGEIRFDLEITIDPCDPNPCPTNTRCVLDGVDLSDGGAPEEHSCLPLTCAEVTCEDRQRCEDRPEGALCLTERCEADGDCEPEAFCELDSGECLPDECVASERRCVEDRVEGCEPSGAGFSPLHLCDSTQSTCVERDDGEAFCRCENDWACPQYMRCEAGACIGRPTPPECLLPPAPFEASLPTPEIIWGGTATEALAPESPFSESVQVVMTPLVANLTDDNGDGAIDAQDIPEVIFMSFCGGSFTQHGALRAIHGGGPKRGLDLFATLGDQHWYEGEPLPDPQSYTCTQGDIDPTAGLAVADLDDPTLNPSPPEIIAMHEQTGLVVYTHRGEVLIRPFVRAMPNVGPNPTPSVAHLDETGPAEVIVGNVVFTFGYNDQGELEERDLFSGRLGEGRNQQGAVSCVADVDGDGRLEVIGGGTVYRLPRPPMGAARLADCVDAGGAITPLTDEEISWCAGELIVVWDAQEVARSLTPDATVRSEGFCAVADVLGADLERPTGPSNPLDGAPEVILISNGTLSIHDGATGRLRFQERFGLSNNDRGGAPNIDDFDGDGFPEIGSAFARGYVMMDLQPPSPNCPSWDTFIDDEDLEGLMTRPQRTPGPDECQADTDCVADESVCRNQRCVCLHNGWRRSTEDDSSKVTGSTLFDFNGDDAVEVIYNDECFFRIYDGRDGKTLFRQPSESRTRIEHPIVADVDNDGNAEIVFSTSTESQFCSIRGREDENGVRYRDQYNPGIEVWGDPQDRWVPARRIWSQHAYHVTHINESGHVPVREPSGWTPINGRTYNSYRAQPRSYGIAPDLQIINLRASTNAACEGASDLLTISAQVSNLGEVRVGEGVRLIFDGIWRSMSGEETVQPLLDALGGRLELRTPLGLNPESGLTVRVAYSVTEDPSALPFMGTLPDEVVAYVDVEEGSDFGRERECREDNNDARAEVVNLGGAAELTVEILGIETGLCPALSLTVLVSNQGSIAVDETALSLYAGDPRSGGGRLSTLPLTTPIPAGGEQTIVWSVDRFPESREINFFVSIDPQNLIEECDEEDNIARAPEPLSCDVNRGK
jgi:hypothetical protein